MPDSYTDAWRKADEDYDRREQQRIDQEIQDLLRTHDWRGGYYCACGEPINMPAGWGRHLLTLALVEEAS